jgi:hypothetical protein
MVESSKQQSDFIDELKLFITSTIHKLHKSGKHPFVLIPTSNKKQVGEPMSWDFDCREFCREKRGNFSSPVVMKLVSKYNKKQSGAPLNAIDVCNDIVEALN